MKKITFFLVIGLFSCLNEERPDESPSALTGESKRWSTYEGRIPLNEKTNLYIELSMFNGETMDEGSFILDEYLEADHVYTPVSSFTGKYSTLYGEVPGKMIVQFHNSAHAEGLKRTFLSTTRATITGQAVRIIREEVFRDSDLAVMTEGTNKLLVLNQRFQPVSLEHQFNLFKRTSRLFTIEGYFRHKGDTAEFFEMNTRETWPVSKLGDYYHASRQYYQLTTDKFQVTYMKALAFSIEHPEAKGEFRDALVLKRVLQMSSSAAP
jgi:hypothetical protein